MPTLVGFSGRLGVGTGRSAAAPNTATLAAYPTHGTSPIGSVRPMMQRTCEPMSFLSPLRRIFLFFGLVSCLGFSSSTPSFAAAAGGSTNQAESGRAVGAILGAFVRARQEGHPENLLERLKVARDRWPDDERIRVALATAYLGDENPSWAVRVLGEYLDAHPDGCQARALLVWIQLRDAHLDQAEAALTDIGRCASPSDLTRLHLLAALVAEQRGQTTIAREHVRAAMKSSELYEQDAPILARLQRTYDPSHRPWLNWQLGTRAGTSTSGLSEAPVDAPVPPRSTSALIEIDGHLAARVRTDAAVQPAMDLDLSLEDLDRDARVARSYQALALRPGVWFGQSQIQVRVGYGFETVNLARSFGGETTSSRYLVAHRAEYELRMTPGLTAYGDLGWRSVRGGQQSGLVFDQGLAWQALLDSHVRLDLDARGEWARAKTRAYDRIGATVGSGLVLALPHDFELREKLAVTGELYPRSQGFFAGTGSKDRRETTTKVGVTLWSPTLFGVRLGAEYQYTQRESTANAYNLVDHRTLLEIRWNQDSDQAGRSLVNTPSWSTPIGQQVLSATEARSRAGISELMQRDESERQRSTCAK